ncbi:hypothetical protein CXG81DRAFT_14659, partial [Caulochytrium protostelioides]
LGLSVEPNKTYRQVVDASFRITMASLAYPFKQDESRVTHLLVRYQDREFTLCNLNPTGAAHQALDLMFMEGEEIAFLSHGPGTIDLTGNYEIDSDDLSSLGGRKKFAADDEEENSDDNDDDDDEEDSDDDGEENSDDEDPEIDEEQMIAALESLLGKKRTASFAGEAAPKKAKITEIDEQAAATAAEQKQQQQEQKQKQQAAADKKAAAAEQKQAAEQKKAAADKKAAEQKAAAEKKAVRVLGNGLRIEDVVEGSGEKAKAGRTVSVRYVGKLTNGKQFDANTSGRPFSFKLGTASVIRGWDIGIQNMKVGGTRKLRIPAALAYGSQRVGSIPANSVLDFEVKLLGVK